jgi:hypothetical protein
MLAVILIEPDSLRRPMRRERPQACSHRVPNSFCAFAATLQRQKCLAMLPGFRFLFGAIVMCMSVLVFGLGATALIRAAHEDFASNPTWRAPPEPRFAQQDEADRTVLAVLSVQSPATEPAASPSVAETTAASPPPDGSPPDTTKPAADAPVEAAAESDRLPAQAEAAADAPASASETKVVAAEPAPQQLSTPESSPAATRIATLGGPAVITEETAAAKASASNATLDRSELNKRLRDERAKERRRLAARRAKLAQQAAATPFEITNPFIPHPLVAPQASAH